MRCMDLSPNKYNFNSKIEKSRGGDSDYIITILCCHTFHWKCLKNWNETTCPLCRY